MVFDSQRKEAYYFDSNGPNSSTTPHIWKQSLQNQALQLGYAAHFMSANPQAWEKGPTCAAWASMASVLVVHKFLANESVSLSLKDFTLVDPALLSKQDLQNHLQQNITNFMIYVVTAFFGTEAIEDNHTSKYMAFKEEVKFQGLNMEEDVLVRLFSENRGLIEQCWSAITSNVV